MHKTRTVGSINRTWQAALLAASVAGALTLGGCGDSPTSEANRKAQANSENAARLTASAGDVRPSADLIKRVESGSREENQRLGQELDTAAQNGKLPEGMTKYLTPVPADTVMAAGEDLKKAADLIDQALKAPDGAQPGPQFQAALFTQQGQIADQRAQLLTGKLVEDYAQLVTKATEIQGIAHRVIMQASAAGNAESRRKTLPPDMSKSLEDAKAAVSGTRQAADEKAAAAKALQDQVNAKREDARKLYDRAQADQLAADQAKGPESVAAFEKSVKIRGEADKIAQEIANLLPKLQAANSDAAVAGAKAKEAKDSVDILTLAQESLNKQLDDAQKSGDQLRADAKNLLDTVDGAKGLLAPFKDGVGKIDASAGEAAKLGDSAASAYKVALTQYVASREATLKAMKPDDPTRRDVERKLPDALLNTLRAGGHYHAAEAYLIAWSATALQESVEKAVAEARQRVDEHANPPADTSGRAKNNKDLAMKALTDADVAADAAINVPLPKTEDASPGRWLAYSLKAVVNQDLARLGDADRQGKAYEAAQEALRRNPNLALQFIARPTGAVSPAGGE